MSTEPLIEQPPKRKPTGAAAHKREPIVPLADDEIEQCAQFIGKNEPGYGKAIRALREATGISQESAASAIHRKGPTWHAWEAEKSSPPPHIVPELLRVLNVPLATISRALSLEVDLDLDPRLYFKGDPVLVEYRFWLKKRGYLIQKFVKFAEEGSAQHAALCIKLWEKNADDMDSRKSGPVRIVEGKSRSIVSGALKQAQIEAPGEVIEVSNETAGETQEGQAPLDNAEDPSEKPQPVDISENDTDQ